MPSDLAAAFVERSGHALTETNERAIDQALANAAAAYPQIRLASDAFARHVGDKCRGAGDLVEALSRIALSDLFVAFGAANGDRAALEELDRVLRTAAKRAARVDSREEFVEEVTQRLRERVLLPHEGKPRLLEYGGQGPLVGWCRVVATRVALNMKATPERDVTLQSQILEKAGAATGLETGAVRAQHSAALTKAFAAAARALTHEERVLLRYHFVDGLNFEEMAPIFNTHRSTISRRVAATREKLLAQTKAALRDELGADSAELSSLINDGRGELELDLTAWLRTQS